MFIDGLLFVDLVLESICLILSVDLEVIFLFFFSIIGDIFFLVFKCFSLVFCMFLLENFLFICFINLGVLFELVLVLAFLILGKFNLFVVVVFVVCLVILVEFVVECFVSLLIRIGICEVGKGNFFLVIDIF